MRTRLRRFALVGVAATTVDVALLVGLHAAGLSLVLADVLALAGAAALSYGSHRAVTFREDPFVRWMHHAGPFAVVVVLAGVVDVAVLQLLAASDDGTQRVLAAKIVAVAFAAVVRAFAYRTVLFRVVRREQDAPSLRPPAAGTYRLSVVVPAYREPRIGETVHRLRSELAIVTDGGGLELVVVDDGSDDDTAAIARTAGADQVIVLERNQGKGAAVRAGMLAANGKTVAFTDADLAYAPAQLVSLLERVEDGWDVVVGSRRHRDASTVVHAAPLREMGSRMVNLATHALLLGQYRDTQCGLKAFRSDVAALLFSSGRIDGFAFDIEVLHLVERHRLSLAEVPVAVENSERSTVRAARDGIRLLADLLRIRRWAKQGVYDGVVTQLPPRATGQAAVDAR